MPSCMRAPPLIRLGRVSTLRVLRREWNGVAAREGLAWGLGALVLAGLLVAIARDWLLGAWVVGGFALAFAVYGLVAWLVLGLLGHLRAVAGSGWRYGLAALRRRPVASLVQVLALGMGLTALLLLTLVRSDLLDNWRQATPADAPNRFVINIQPDQLAPLRAFFTGDGRPAPLLQPMIRGRLVAVNGRPVGPDDYTDDRARRLVDRDFNLSFDSRLPDGNSVVAGRWHGADTTPQFSVEQGLAQTLGLAMGDVLSFEIAGVRSEARITSLRKLDWDSMRVNFFVIAAPGMLEFHGQTGGFRLLRREPSPPGTARALVQEAASDTVARVSVTVAAGKPLALDIAAIERPDDLHDLDGLLMQPHDLLAPLMKLFQRLFSGVLFFHPHQTQKARVSSYFIGPDQ